MALINPSNLYSGGNVQLNSTPYLNYQLKQEAEKKAKEDALNKYFGQKLANVTATGVREEEAKLLGTIKNDISNYFAQNKESILNTNKDGGKAYGELQKKFNQAEQVINAGKILNEENKSLAKLLSNPNTASLLDMETFSAEKSKHDQPSYIYDNGQLVENPNFKKFDISGITFNPKEMNEKDWSGYMQGIRKTFEPDTYSLDYQPSKDNKYKLVKTEVRKYSPKALKNIAEQAINDYNSSKRLSYSFRLGHDLVKGSIEDYKEDNEQKFNELNTTFKQIMGRDIEKPSDIHAAEMIKANSISFPKVGTETNIAALEANKTARMQYLENARENNAGEVYNGYQETVDIINASPNKRVPLTSLSQNLADVYFKAASFYDKSPINAINKVPKNYEISTDANGNISIYKIGNPNPIGAMNELDINTEVNQPYGTKIKNRVPKTKTKGAKTKITW